ncbi:hypothetical protein NQ318_009077 [Aromia moschata]|uniref:Uncharacterized protein n=1 Tax=Aromia moschata TaxID=1265417 RepID=A0AAV8YUJ6_9CUCU|nr:hypothetical protein NQ318_009077 [Aromia moschata]
MDPETYEPAKFQNFPSYFQQETSVQNFIIKALVIFFNAVKILTFRHLCNYTDGWYNLLLDANLVGETLVEKSIVVRCFVENVQFFCFYAEGSSTHSRMYTKSFEAYHRIASP